MEPGNWVFIEEHIYRSPNLYSMLPKYRVIYIQPYIQQLYASSGEIQDRIQKMAEDISEYFGERTITFLIILRGAFRFAKDLANAFDKLPLENLKPYELQFIRCKSYTNENQTDDVQITGFDIENLRGKDVLIIEDLIDTGKTMTALYNHIRNIGANDVKLACLAFKRTERRKQIVMPDFLGFSLPDTWIVGYHMDYNDYFRDFPHLGFINDDAKEAFRLGA